MKINCNVTSTGSSLVLPPSPGTALGFPSQVASLILNPLQVAINKPKLETSFITSVPHTKVKSSNNTNTITSNYTTFSTSSYRQQTIYSHTHTSYNHNNTGNTTDADHNCTNCNTNSKDNCNSTTKNGDSDNNDDNDMNGGNNDNENNYNYNNTTHAKRKWESPDVVPYTKCRKPTDSNIPNGDQLCNTTIFSTSFLYLSKMKEEAKFDLDAAASLGKGITETSAAAKTEQDSDFKLEDSANLLHDIKLLDYAQALLDENKILDESKLMDQNKVLLDDESVKLMDSYGSGSLLLDGEVDKSYPINPDTNGDTMKGRISKLTADGADFLQIEEDEDESDDDDDESDDEDCLHEHDEDTKRGNERIAEIPDLYSNFDHDAERMEPDSPTLSSDACEILCTVGNAHEWVEKETASSSTPPPPQSAEEREEEFNPYTFIKNLPFRDRPSPGGHALLPPVLPTDLPFTLVLDLDETLVHCSTESLALPDLVFPVTFNSVEYTVFARKRPHIHEFLSRVSSLFEVVVFTASQEVYADKLLNILDPDRKFIKHRLFRDSCLCVEGNYLKDLSVLGRDLSKVIIVDNSPQAFGYHIDNGIPIESWFDDDNDTELLTVSTFLESLLTADDVRPLIREKYKLHELISRA